MLQALLSPVQIASHTAAQALAEFAAVDIPSKRWPTLLGTLLSYVGSPSVAVETKVASLEVSNYLHMIKKKINAILIAWFVFFN